MVREILEILELKEQSVLRETQGVLVTQETQVHKVRWDQQEMSDQQEPQETLEHKVR